MVVHEKALYRKTFQNQKLKHIRKEKVHLDNHEK